MCDPAIFGVLRQTPPGRGGEIQLTDALKTLAQMPASEGGGVYGVLFHGRRFDTGNRIDYLRTLDPVRLERPDVAAEFVPWLRKYLDDLKMTGMVPMEAHLARVLAGSAHPLAPVMLGLEDAEGGVLAADAIARCPLPSFDNSSMDGYAVHAARRRGRHRRRPGHPPVSPTRSRPVTSARTVAPGTCARIMTGAMMPGGADAVVPVEWTDGGTGTGAVSASPPRPATRSGGAGMTSPKASCCSRRAPARPGPDRAAGGRRPWVGARPCRGRGSR